MDPQTNPSDDETKKIRALREEDVRRATELGRKRSEQEAALHAKLHQKKEDEHLRGEEIAHERDMAWEAQGDKKKEFFVQKKKQDAEVEADKARRAKEAKMIEDQQLARQAKRKKEQKYMDELHAAAKEKFEHEQEKNMARQAKLNARQDAERVLRDEKLRIENEERRAMDELERDTRAKKAVTEEQKKKALYELEQWLRMQAFAIEGDVHTKMMHAKINREPANREATGVQMEERRRKATLAGEHEKRKATIENDARSKLIAIDGLQKVEINKIRADSSNKKNAAERAYHHELERIERTMK